MSCLTPIEAPVLVDYWIEALVGYEEEAVEEHLLGCDACGARLREVIALAEGVRALAHGGSLQMVVSDVLLKRAAANGLCVREYAPPLGGSVQCTVTAEVDILVGRLAANLNTAKQIDIAFCDEGGVERARMVDIPFDPAAESVVFQKSITVAKAAPSETMIARLVAVDDSGDERLLGEYTFHHTRTLPGPGAW